MRNDLESSALKTNLYDDKQHSLIAQIHSPSTDSNLLLVRFIFTQL